MAATTSPQDPEEGCLTNFTHDTWRFPEFEKIDPDAGLLGDPFYEESEDRWCLFAEIVDVSLLLRVRLVARDREGATVVIAFYPDNADRASLDTRQFKVGHTIALVYPMQHYFLDGTQGVRVEDLQSFRVFPVKMAEVFRVNDELCTYWDSRESPKKCHACGKQDSSLVKCGRCGFYYYCNKDCQTTGWNQKGHKAACRVLKDANLRALVRITDGEGERRFAFPS
ncbi:hypothetical protein CkaCkLH20_01612 [Colletotrichum karsti]|uniref:MYND-type domain-containing protein n=1 Tax=Colletotrichum karsti TaxID=1095194 RepID=A0A9P6IIX3_9PEZI|nr:uncharacterized protein CkaCkLH20_01612 [Colletotrichum karsti]KAF9880570.1 hypothetical protein CkaCkLH20_01612 [Colletotrichum karsti]